MVYHAVLFEVSCSTPNYCWLFLFNFKVFLNIHHYGDMYIAQYFEN